VSPRVELFGFREAIQEAIQEAKEMDLKELREPANGLDIGCVGIDKIDK
jgi:hypothetical protein